MRRCLLVPLSALVYVLAGQGGAVAASAAPPPPASAAAAPAAEPWWVPLAFRGTPVTALSVGPDGTLLVTAGGRGLMSGDGGRTFAPLRSAGPPAGVGASCPASLGPPVPLVLCARPAALPGVVVGVAADGTVWRRTGSGTWGRSLLLLPGGGLGGVPAITSITAFADEPLSPAVYLGTDGYAVIESGDGGDDWIRDDPGLPPAVLALSADARRRAVYAGTGDGLWVHHLRSNPAPPAYRSDDLTWRRAATALLAVLATAAGAGLLVALTGGRRPVRG